MQLFIVGRFVIASATEFFNRHVGCGLSRSRSRRRSATDAGAITNRSVGCGLDRTADGISVIAGACTRNGQGRSLRGRTKFCNVPQGAGEISNLLAGTHIAAGGSIKKRAAPRRNGPASASAPPTPITIRVRSKIRRTSGSSDPKIPIPTRRAASSRWGPTLRSVSAA